MADHKQQGSSSSSIAPGHQYQHIDIHGNAKAQLGDTYHFELDSPLDRLPFAENAPFNSYSGQHEPTCLPDTRVDVLREIYNWADGHDERCIFWLNGWAGTGKSTIARTVARKYHDQKSLGASFFFSKGGGDVGHAGKFVTSIAIQLANGIPPLRGHICNAIMECSDIVTRSLSDQWNQLVLAPLSKLDSKSCPSYVLVVDALDECDNDNNIRVILYLLAKARSVQTVRLRVFLTSRPEIPIRHGLCHIPDDHQDFILHSISPVTVGHDITIFFEHELALIGKERSLGACWPSKETIEHLVQGASGLFIWASTTCRFIREGKQFAPKRLATILEGTSSTTSVTAPEKRLNEIYITVLRDSVCAEYTDEERVEMYSMLRRILGSIVVLFSPLSVKSLTTLLHVAEREINETLEDLHAILDILEDKSIPVRLHHPSFRDFLLDPKRCTDSNFLVNEKEVHQMMADNCIHLMSTALKQDICSVRAPGTLVSEVGGTQVEQGLPPEVQYACLYWVQHLQMGDVQLCDDGEVHQLLQIHLLHWLEALSWMKKISEGIYAITSLESIVLKHDSPQLYKFVHDAKRFALYGRPAIEQGPLQVYSSALVFAPMATIVRKQFGDRIPGWICRLPEVRNDWSALVQTLEGHSDSVSAVAFSPDSKLLASGSMDKTVRLWDICTGAALQTLEGHRRWIKALAFSSDSKLLASASIGMIRLWDAGTGAALRTLDSRWGIFAVAFSPDGKRLASASSDVVQIWDADKGKVLQTFRGYSAWVIAVAFSPDGKLLASASFDRTVKLWNASTGAELQSLKGHWAAVKAVVFSPDGKLLASVSKEYTVKLWDTGTGAALHTLEGQLGSVFSVPCSSPTSTWFDDIVGLRDAGMGVEAQRREESMYAMAFSPDGKLLVSAADGSKIKLWGAKMGAMPQTLEGHRGKVKAVALSPDCKLLASASTDTTVKLWDTGTGTALQVPEFHSDSVAAVAFSPDGKLLASVFAHDRVKLWNTAIGTALRTLEPHLHRVKAMAFSPDGKLLMLASWENTVKLCDVATGAAILTLKSRPWGGMGGVAFSSNSKLLAVASADNKVGLWDTATGAALQTLKVDWIDASAMAFSPDRRLLALASWFGSVKLWDLSKHARVTGATPRSLGNCGMGIKAMAFSPDSKLLALAPGHTVKLLDVSTGAALQTIEVNTAIQTLSFSDDGTSLKTNKGQLAITSLSSGVVPQQGLSRGIFVQEQWVTWQTKKILWLPPEYRSEVAAVHGSVVALGSTSGLVLMKFAF